MSDIRSALEAAYEDSDKDQPQTTVVETVPAPETEQNSAKTGTTSAEQEQQTRQRDEQGRFAASEKPTLSDVPKPPVESARNPFSSWKPDAQSALLKAERGEALTVEELKVLRAEAERREGDFHKGLNEFKTHSERAKAYDQAFAPFQDHLRSLGVDAPTAIRALMNADKTLRTSAPAEKLAYFSNLAREYGIDIGQLQNPQSIDPNTQYLMQQVNMLQQRQQQWQNQAAQHEQMRVQGELKSFATAERPHFEAVRNEMADLLETGRAQTLQEAYDMAVWMKPDVRQTLIEKQLADARHKATEQAQAQRAKTAAIGVKGSNPSGAGGQPVNGSLRDIIAQQLADN